MKTIYESDELEITKGDNEFRVIDKISDHWFRLNFFDDFCDKHGNKINKWNFCKQYPVVMPILVDLGKLKKWKNGFRIKTDGNTHYFDMQMIHRINKKTGAHVYYSKYDNLHRTDGPAIEYADGGKHWLINDKRHRIDGPAIEYADGEKQWWINDKRHRTDGPAIEYADGGKEWWINDKWHRTDGPAVEYADGGKHWYINDKHHRTDGPAIIWRDGGKHWYIDDKHHRTDGPAIIWRDGGKEWWINDNEITEDVEQWLAENNYTYPFDKSTQAKFILKFV